jgi:eukaryotic-like serine/threonine-protein kinase
MSVARDTQQRQPSEPTGLSPYQLGRAVRIDDLAVYYTAQRTNVNHALTVAILRRNDPLSLARFRLAAKLGTQVSHPGLLPVLATGRDSNYGDYMVTPDTGGQSLDVILHQGALDPIHVVQIFGQLATVIDALHDQQIIHRDLQPAYILVADDLSVQLTGLGFAACEMSRELIGFDDRDLSNPYYPGSMHLGVANATSNDDLYALGMMLYHMVHGGSIPTTPLESLATINPDYAVFDRVIRRLMGTGGGQRYTSATQAVESLRYASGNPTVEKQLVADRSDEAWDSIAEWLENPLEVLLTHELDPDYLSRSRARADTLHHIDAIRRLLERWARQGMFRRSTISQLIQPTQILSSNFYLYELRVHYEKRSEPHVSRKVHRSGHAVPPQTPISDVWDVDITAPERFVDVPSAIVRIPGTQLIVRCEECSGSGKLLCGECNGRGTVDRKQRMRNSDGSVEQIIQNETCGSCRGYGKINCTVCDSIGNMLEEQYFHWSRYGKRFFNEDDTTGLHLRTLESNAQVVFSSAIDLNEPRWRQVAPLREMMTEATREEGEQVHAIDAELIIKATPVTEVDYLLNNNRRTLTVVGFQNVMRGDIQLYDIERIVLYATVTILIIAVAVMVVVTL